MFSQICLKYLKHLCFQKYVFFRKYFSIALTSFPLKVKSTLINFVQNIFNCKVVTQLSDKNLLLKETIRLVFLEPSRWKPFQNYINLCIRLWANSFMIDQISGRAQVMFQKDDLKQRGIFKFATF